MIKKSGMVTRRRALQGGLVAGGAFAAGWPSAAFSQSQPRTAVRYVEVIRSMMYTPAYVAIAKGFFEEVGLDVTLVTGQGGDKTTAALLSNNGDIGLIGPERTIYVETSESPLKLRVFCGLVATDGYLLVGREATENFQWEMLKGKEVIGRSRGSTPLVYLEWALREHGIDPEDVEWNNNLAVPARPGAWISGQGDYAIFVEPDASQLELEGNGHVLASVGEAVGMVDFTAFTATDKYIEENPEVIQAWTNAIFRAQKWTASAPISEIVEVQQQFFPGVDPGVLATATERYRRLNIWKTTPLVEKSAIDTFQEMLVQGNVLDPTNRVEYENVVITEFANNAN